MICTQRKRSKKPAHLLKTWFFKEQHMRNVSLESKTYRISLGAACEIQRHKIDEYGFNHSINERTNLPIMKSVNLTCSVSHAHSILRGNGIYSSLHVAVINPFFESKIWQPHSNTAAVGNTFASSNFLKLYRNPSSGQFKVCLVRWPLLKAMKSWQLSSSPQASWWERLLPDLSIHKYVLCLFVNAFVLKVSRSTLFGKNARHMRLKILESIWSALCRALKDSIWSGETTKLSLATPQRFRNSFVWPPPLPLARPGHILNAYSYNVSCTPLILWFTFSMGVRCSPTPQWEAQNERCKVIKTCGFRWVNCAIYAVIEMGTSGKCRFSTK